VGLFGFPPTRWAKFFGIFRNALFFRESICVSSRLLLTVFDSEKKSVFLNFSGFFEMHFFFEGQFVLVADCY